MGLSGLWQVPDLPATAWQQAVFVSLFVVFVITMTIVIVRAVNSVQQTWQDFIEARDREWQAWLTQWERRTSYTLRELARNIERISDNLHSHDLRVEERILETRRQAYSEPPTQPIQYAPQPPPEKPTRKPRTKKAGPAKTYESPEPDESGSI